MQVFQVDAPGLRSEFPPLRSLDVVGGQPAASGDDVHRPRSRDRVAWRISVRESSLVTLTGVGGVGKTRLALQVAAEVVTDFPDGAWLCEFAPIDRSGRGVGDAGGEPARAGVSGPDPRRVGARVSGRQAPAVGARQLRAPPRRDRPPGRRDHAALCPTCRWSRRVAKGSRSPANGSSRCRHWESRPTMRDLRRSMDADAVRLFVDRAEAAKNDFVLTDRNATAVGVLCRRLDGIPLAIELAAARVRSLSPEDLVARLDQRFKLLTRGQPRRARTASDTAQHDRLVVRPPRSDRTPRPRSPVGVRRELRPGRGRGRARGRRRSMRSTWSTCWVSSSTSRSSSSTTTTAVRYRLLESIRQYAQERLEAGGDTAAVRRRHADHYVGVAETAAPYLRSRHQIEWAQRRRTRHRQLPGRARLGRRDTVARTRAPAGRTVHGSGHDDRRRRERLGRDGVRDPGQ